MGTIPFESTDSNRQGSFLAAAVIVTDNFPCFFLPKMVAAAAKKLPCRLESVDSNGIVPIAAHEKDYKAAAHFRRRMQGILRNHLPNMPVAQSLGQRNLPAGATIERQILQNWPPAPAALLEVREDALAALPIDHEVFVVEAEGGAPAAERALKRFVERRIRKYPDDRNHPDIDATSRLSPYLHFGMISAHQIFKAVADAEDWTLTQLSDENKGARAGWWGMSEGSEAFLDQLITWRELGYNTCAKQPTTYDKYESLPEWARDTLEHHEADDRPHLYSRTQIENAQTHDPVFNSAMRQMREEGWFHNYLRMLWGKKILEWSPDGRTALNTMETIMNRWSLDGRNPNSYSGYFWTLGRYDRGWPERAIFGKVRCMTSKSTRRKVDMEDYLQRFGEPTKNLSLPFDKT